MVVWQLHELCGNIPVLFCQVPVFLNSTRLKAKLKFVIAQVASMQTGGVCEGRGGGCFRPLESLEHEASIATLQRPTTILR
jgi:hypothetical protein